MFESSASNLVSGDTNGRADVFVKDLATNSITRISTASDGTQGNGASFSLSISADGRYVVFESSASNLVSGDTNGTQDVFVKDLTTNSITRISTASDGTQGNSSSYDPAISTDGRYVVFDSYASNLVSGDTNGIRDVFISIFGVINGSASITVNPINDAPVIINNNSTTVFYIENDTTAIDSTIIVSDVDSANLVSAAVSITNGFTLGQDHLNFTNQNGITGSYNSNTGVLTLTGSATVADYQTALRSIIYASSSDIPNNILRTISFQVNDGSLDSSVVTRNVTIIPEAPITGNGYNPLTGTTGNDVIIGGPGAKTLTGNGGNDVFVFNSLKDVGQSITDFAVGDDKIDISQLLTNIGYSGTDPIADGYVKFVLGSTANSSVLQIDRDGVLGSAIFKNFLQLDNVTPTQMNNSNNFVFGNNISN